MTGEEKALWLDCDPGHDDAIALLLALFGRSSFVHPTLLGVSSVHGNNTGHNTFVNAARMLDAYGVEPGMLWRGADVPLMRDAKIDEGIHGDDGLGGVTGLSTQTDEGVQRQMYANLGPVAEKGQVPEPDPLGLVSHLVELLKRRIRDGQGPLTIVATGPLTNVALLLKLAPPGVVQRGVDQIVLMGGAAGVPGNRTPLAEWNILVDPEAARIVFSYPLPTVMAGLNITHQALFTESLHSQLVSLSSSSSSSDTLIDTLASIMAFFAASYADTFGFAQGPPVHDFLAVAYVLDPTMFYAHAKPHQHSDSGSGGDGGGVARVSPKRYRVHIETNDGKACGTTIVDFYDQWAPPTESSPEQADSEGAAASWGEDGRNAIVLEHVDTDRLWPLFFDAVKRAQAHVQSQTNTQ